MPHTITVALLLKELLPQLVFIDGLGNPSKGGVPLVQEHLKLLVIWILAIFYSEKITRGVNFW